MRCTLPSSQTFHEVRVSFIPAVRQRVMVEGRDEVFLVVSVDLERGVADLIPLQDGGVPAEDVPVSSLRSTGPLPNTSD